MSFSIDDLTSTLSSSHIGQEALDLAALQAQLAQSLFGQSIAHSVNSQRVARKTSFTQPCNTPTFSHFPSFHDPQHMQTAALGPSWTLDNSSFNSRDDMEEDERMVEELLVPCSPKTPSSPSLHFPMSLSSRSTKHFTSNTQSIPELSSSTFTSTDPFYIAQSQAHQNPSPYSTFTELGQLPQQSPFSSPQRREYSAPSAPAPQLSLETHSFLVATSAAFDR